MSAGKPAKNKAFGGANAPKIDYLLIPSCESRVRHPAAVLDIIMIADYLARATSLAAAERFIASADKTIEQLARMPGMGTRWDSDKPRLADVRFFPVRKFRNHLVFYRPIEGGIEVLRVLHGARDIRSILDVEGDDGA